MRTIAKQAVLLAANMLPPHQRNWGRAMSAELEHVDSGAEALLFALGALVTAVKERFHIQPVCEAARLMAALVFGCLGLFHLSCAVDGLRIALGGSDTFYLTLANSNPLAAEHWRDATLPMTGVWAAVGVADLCVAQFALRNRRHLFGIALVAALFSALTMAATVFSIIGYGEGLHVFLTVVALQAIAAFSLWRFGMRPVQI